MRRRPQRDFWRPAWARWVAECAEAGAAPSGDELARMAWAGAIEQARAGAWEWLDELRERVELPDPFAPSPDLWPALDAFFADPPRRRRGKKRRVDRDVAAAVRATFALLTRPHLQIDEAGRESLARAMTAKEARRWVGLQYAMSPDAVRDIVERRKTYARDA